MFFWKFEIKVFKITKSSVENNMESINSISSKVDVQSVYKSLLLANPYEIHFT